MSQVLMIPTELMRTIRYPMGLCNMLPRENRAQFFLPGIKKEKRREQSKNKLWTSAEWKSCVTGVGLFGGMFLFLCNCSPGRSSSLYGQGLHKKKDRPNLI
ncbi:hypothetical protein CEXT_473351 [Caerostris extrusa]|uniref:Uncharacterized protein n=1 Tax=Caerostris extrusa TaxID=172846 RepID=A0AAV4S4W3_CAEEX|nr:hypothetical protein CEXT_473351 [Caerostris extrusa]